VNSISRFIPSRRWLFIPPLALGIAVVGFLASSKKELTRIDAEEIAKPLKVIRVHRQNVSAEAIGFGTVKPRRLWSAVAEVGGRVITAAPNLRSGVPVKQGDLLVTIDPADYQLRTKQRSAELSQANAQLDQLQLTQQSDERSLEIQQDLLAVRQREADRLRQLRSRSAASQSEADAAQAAFLQQKQTVQTLKNTLTTYPAQIASAEAVVELGAARLSESQRDVERTNIIAPFDGLLAGVTLEPDQYVAPRQQLFQIFDTESVEVEAQFSLAQFQRVLDPTRRANLARASAPTIDSKSLAAGGSMADQYAQAHAPDSFDLRDFSAAITMRSGDVSLEYSGKAVRMSESLNEQTRTLGIVIGIDNPAGDQGGGGTSLRPGAYCEVALRSNQTAAAHVVPRTAVNAESLYVVDNNNRLRRRQVQIAFPLREHLAIAAGLHDGDLVVVFPPAVAIEGELVKPQLAEQAMLGSATKVSDASLSGASLSDASLSGGESKQ
jgi:RND family efflux transporter MFP subunit